MAFTNRPTVSPASKETPRPQFKKFAPVATTPTKVEVTTTESGDTKKSPVFSVVEIDSTGKRSYIMNLLESNKQTARGETYYWGNTKDRQVSLMAFPRRKKENNELFGYFLKTRGEGNQLVTVAALTIKKDKQGNVLSIEGPSSLDEGSTFKLENYKKREG